MKRPLTHASNDVLLVVYYFPYNSTKPQYSLLMCTLTHTHAASVCMSRCVCACIGDGVWVSVNHPCNVSMVRRIREVKSDIKRDTHTSEREKRIKHRAGAVTAWLLCIVLMSKLVNTHIHIHTQVHIHSNHTHSCSLLPSFLRSILTFHFLSLPFLFACFHKHTDSHTIGRME